MSESYYEQAMQDIVDALRACVTGEFKTWTKQQHRSLAFYMAREPDAVARATARFLEEQVPELLKAPRELK